jgi:hypothetical protein
MVTLTSPQGERIEVNVSMPATEETMVNQLEEKSLEHIRIVYEYSDVFEREMCPWAISKCFGKYQMVDKVQIKYKGMFLRLSTLF